MAKDSNNNVPFQVQLLFDNLKNKNETIYIRNNYRMRLDEIRKAIDKVIREYDLETVGPPVYTKDKRKAKR